MKKIPDCTSDDKGKTDEKTYKNAKSEKNGAHSFGRILHVRDSDDGFGRICNQFGGFGRVLAR